MRAPTEDEYEDARYETAMRRHERDCDCGQTIYVYEDSEEAIAHNWWSDEPCPWVGCVRQGRGDCFETCICLIDDEED